MFCKSIQIQIQFKPQTVQKTERSLINLLKVCFIASKNAYSIWKYCSSLIYFRCSELVKLSKNRPRSLWERFSLQVQNHQQTVTCDCWRRNLFGEKMWLFVTAIKGKKLVQQPYLLSQVAQNSKAHMWRGQWKAFSQPAACFVFMWFLLPLEEQP